MIFIILQSKTTLLSTNSGGNLVTAAEPKEFTAHWDTYLSPEGLRGKHFKVDTIDTHTHMHTLKALTVG